MLKDKCLRQLKNIQYFIEVKRCRQQKVPPSGILFPIVWITNKCNLRCKMCDQWKTDPVLISQELSTQEWYSFVDSASRMHAVVIVITGGEPFLRKDIFGIIKFIRKKRISCHLCTNGTLLNKNTVDKLKDSGLNSISISLDSNCAEIHNEIRGVDCFDNVIGGIKLLKRMMPEIKIGINYVISKQNFRNMHQMIPFAEKLGVNQIKFGPIHTNLMHRKKSFSSFRNFLFVENDLPELRLEVDKLIYAASQTKLLTTSSTFMKAILNLYKNHPHRLRCYAGYISCAIDALGKVSPCDNFDGNENLRNKPLEEIWRSSSFQHLRNQVHDCASKCWDTTHTELNIRSSVWGFIREFNQTLKDMRFYFS